MEGLFIILILLLPISNIIAIIYQINAMIRACYQKKDIKVHIKHLIIFMITLSIICLIYAYIAYNLEQSIARM